MKFIKICVLLIIFSFSKILASEGGSSVAFGIHGSGINGLSISMNPIFYSTSNPYEVEGIFAKDIYLKYNFGIGGGKIALGWIFWSSPDGPRVDMYKHNDILPFPFFPSIGYGIDFQIVKIYNSGDSKFLNGYTDRNIVYFGSEFGLYFIGAAFKLSFYTSFRGNNHLCISYGLGL